jgi:meiotically up-regulated gene 157 (Mug157) protein
MAANYYYICTLSDAYHGMANEYHDEGIHQPMRRRNQGMCKNAYDHRAGTGFIHESFHKDNPKVFTREWFAWQNTLFGELIIKLVDEGKLNLLNNVSSV